MSEVRTAPMAPHIETVNKVRQLFQQARDGRQKRVQWWRRAYTVVHNRTWNNMREAWMPSPTASEVWPILAALVGWMTDQRPALYVTPAADPGTPTFGQASSLASDLEKTLEANWNARGTTGEIEKVLWDALIYGTGFFKTGWNPALEGGLGDAEMVRVDPFRFYPDPQAACMEDANYFIEARTMSMQELERRFPLKRAAVEAALMGGSEGLDERPEEGSQGSTPMANPAGLFGNAPRYGLPGQSRMSTSDAYDRGVTVFECWVREHNIVMHQPAEDDPKTEHAQPRAEVNDYWRCIVVAGNVVLMDELATDLYGHGRHPYSRMVMSDIGEFWGISMVDHLLPLQLSLNRLLAAAQQHVELVGNPVMVEDSRSGILRTQVVNRPGQRLQKNAGASVEWLNPPVMSNMLEPLIRFYQTEMERVSGLSAIVRGMGPTGRNAQGVLDSIQEAAFVRIRMALRNLELALRESGTLEAGLIAEFYTEPRILAVTGSQNMTPVVLQARHFYMRHDMRDPSDMPLKFSLWIQAGSSMPTSRSARAAEADELFAMGAIDPQAVLEAHDFPNRAAVIERVAQQRATGMFEPPGKRPKVGS